MSFTSHALIQWCPSHRRPSHWNFNSGLLQAMPDSMVPRFNIAYICFASNRKQLCLHKSHFACTMAFVLLAVGWAWQPRVVRPVFQVPGYWVATFSKSLLYDGSELQYRVAAARLAAEQPHLQFTFDHMHVETPAPPPCDRLVAEQFTFDHMHVETPATPPGDLRPGGTMHCH